jgi:hypothetical protein
MGKSVQRVRALAQEGAPTPWLTAEAFDTALTLIQTQRMEMNDKDERELDVAQGVVWPAFYGGSVRRSQDGWTVNLLEAVGDVDRPCRLTRPTFRAALNVAIAKGIRFRSRADILRRYRLGLQDASIGVF